VALSDLDPTEATARYAAATSSEYRRLHEPLRRHSTQTRRIVERIEEIGRALTPPDLFGAECGDASSLKASNVATMRSVTS
jgi:hypothetical protein